MNNNGFCCLGLDVSSKTIGITVLDLTGNLKEIFHISLPKSSKKNGDIDIYDKIVYFSDIVKKLKNKYDIKHIFIEAPLQNGPAISTVLLLAKFNGMVSMELYRTFGIKPTHNSVHECRKAFFPEYTKQKKQKGEIVTTLSLPTNVDKKKLVLEKVNKIAPYIMWHRDKNMLIKEESYDMADSFVVAMSGLIIGGFITEIKDQK